VNKRQSDNDEVATGFMVVVYEVNEREYFTCTVKQLSYPMGLFTANASEATNNTERCCDDFNPFVTLCVLAVVIGAEDDPAADDDEDTLASSSLFMLRILWRYHNPHMTRERFRLEDVRMNWIKLDKAQVSIETVEDVPSQILRRQ
jgi:hypothetical protein